MIHNIYIYMMYTYIYIYIYVWMYIYIYIYLFISYKSRENYIYIYILKKQSNHFDGTDASIFFFGGVGCLRLATICEVHFLGENHQGMGKYGILNAEDTELTYFNVTTRYDK